MPSLQGHLSAEVRRRRAQYLRALEAVYQAICTVTGRQVIVDASKLPAYASVLLDSTQLDVRVMFLVRDARATAFSWRRRKSTSVRGRTFTAVQYSAFTSAKEWLVTNWAAERVLQTLAAERVLRVRYEDVMRQPAQALRRIARFAGLPEDSLPLQAPNQAYLQPAHLIAGNQDRFRTGRVVLRPDEEWRTAMRPWDRLVVTMLTLPLLRRYGYV